MLPAVQNLVYVCGLMALVFGAPTTEASRHHRGPANRRTSRHLERCSEPTDLKERLDEVRTSHLRGELHETFYMLPFLRDAIVNKTEVEQYISDGQVPDRSQVFSGTKECPVMDKARELAVADPCPTYVSVNKDNSRYPRILVERQCQCRRCLGIPKRHRFLTPSCEGLFYHVRVLKRTGCKDGVHQYVAAWEELQTGCACRLVS